MKCDTTADLIKEKDVDVLSFLTNVTVRAHPRPRHGRPPGRWPQPASTRRDSALSCAWNGHVALAQGPTPGTWGHSAATGEAPYAERASPPFGPDVQQAETTHDESGANNGFKLKFEFKENPYFTNTVRTLSVLHSPPRGVARVARSSPPARPARVALTGSVALACCACCACSPGAGEVVPAVCGGRGRAGEGGGHAHRVEGRWVRSLQRWGSSRARASRERGGHAH